MDDSAMYTGVDNIENGQFGNEGVDKQTQQLLDEQKRKVAELTPKLEALVTEIDSEIRQVESIDRFYAATSQPESDIRAELQAAALYKKYLQGLKTKFTLALAETKR
jgi:TRAP-type uncharacterized transport system substrate-binding protein